MNQQSTPNSTIEQPTIPDEDRNAIRACKQTLEDEYDISIVAMRDVGSHAWGLASDSSDYDVAFVFVQPERAYYSRQDKRDSLETAVNLDVDAVDRDVEWKAWNITRFRDMIAESNASALRFLASGVRYTDTVPSQFEEIEQEALSSFRPGAMIGHSFGQAGRMYQDYLVENLIYTPYEHENEVRLHDYEIPLSEAQTKGTITVEHAQSGEQKTIHLSQVGSDQKWRLVKRSHVRKDEWNVVERDDDAGEVHVRNDDLNEERTIDLDEIGAEDSEWRWASTDRSPKRWLYVVRSLLNGGYIAAATEDTDGNPPFPPLSVDELLDEYLAFPESLRPFEVPESDVREAIRLKRAGDASASIEDFDESFIGDAMDALEECVHDGRFHQRQINDTRIDELTIDLIETCSP